MQHHVHDCQKIDGQCMFENKVGVVTYGQVCIGEINIEKVNIYTRGFQEKREKSFYTKQKYWIRNRFYPTFQWELFVSV